MNRFLSERSQSIQLPEWSDRLGQSLGDAERELAEAAATGEYVNLTYADTKRFPVAPWVLDAFSKAASAGRRTYTPYRGDPAIREQVAANLSAFLGVPVDAHRELVLTPGSQGALFTALAATVNPGDCVLIGDPDYLSYERLVRLFGATAAHVPFLWEDGKPTFDFDVLEALIRERRPRVMLFSNPNNPTGGVLGKDVLARLSALAQEHDFLIIVDELYSRLVYDGLVFDHLIAHEGMRERCITVLGPSKTESMSGYRLGVAVAPAPIATRMEDVLGLTVLRAPAYGQHTLVGWLRDDIDYITHRISEYQKLRDYTVTKLRESGVYEVVTPQGTAYVFARVVGSRVPSDQELCLALVREARAIVNPGYQFGPRGVGHIRLCFAQDEEVLEAVLERIVSVTRRLTQSVVSSVS